jgi:hypothetical protein
MLVQATADGADLAWKTGHALFVLGIVFLRRGGASLTTDAAVARRRSRSGVRRHGGGRWGRRVGSLGTKGREGWLSSSASL